MNLNRELTRMILSRHTLGQKLNYIKYLFSSKSETLHYSPVTISIVATTRCTLSCRMCPTHSPCVPKDYEHAQKNVKDMSFDMFKGVIDRFDKASTVHIIGSGEPLLNKDFFRMVDYASGKSMTVKTFSNGTTVGEHIDELLDSKLDGITISINGQNAREFNRMTGMPEEVYCKVYDAAKTLTDEKVRRRAKTKVKLSFIIDRYNYTLIPEKVAMGLEMGVDHIFFCNFLPAPYDGLNVSERVVMARSGAAYEVKAMFDRYPAAARKRLTPPVFVDPDKLENLCNTHFSQIRFDGDGNVSSCSMMLLNMSGNGDYNDTDVWNNAFFRNMRRAFLSRDAVSIKDPCKVCPDNKGVAIGK